MRICGTRELSKRKAPSLAGPLLLGVLGISTAETVVEYLLAALPVLPTAVVALVHATTMVAATAPMLVCGWFRFLRGESAAFAEYRQTVEAAALQDVATNLPNRTGFQKYVDREIQSAVRTHGDFAVVVFDVRRFGDINGMLGHRGGDILLRQLGERLQSSAAALGAAARLGSDIFGILLCGVARERAQEVIETLHRLIEMPFHVEGALVEIEAHSGYALFPTHGDDADVLLRRAEVALRHAKKTGQRSAVYEAEKEACTRRGLRMIGLLRAAIERGDLTLVYQPKVAVANGEPAGVEALVRWNTPALGPVAPSEFIPLAEQAGLMKPLTRWVLGEALRQMAAWRSGGPEVKVAVNLSARNLTDEGLGREIGALLARWDIPPQRLTLELTESAVMEDPARAAAVLEELAALGVELSIDDFGTGHSSLTYLRTVPAVELKVDRSFVRDMVTNEENATIVRAVTGLAHSLGLRVVAEGVEDPATLRRLRVAGVDLAQGYAIARPLSARDVMSFFEQWRPDPLVSLLPESSAAPRDASTACDVRRPSLRDVLRSLRAVPGPSIPVA